MAALTDLEADKLLAFAARCEPRDAIDVYFTLRTVDRDDLFARAAIKDPGFDLYWLAAACRQVETFPDRLEAWPVETIVPLDIAELKRFFAALAAELMAQQDPRRGF